MNKLEEICNDKRFHIAKQKNHVSEAELFERCKAAPRPRQFIENLRVQLAARKPALITEIKKASPSKGVIREHFEPAALARAYAMGGATCLSVLTDEPYFQGSDQHLRDVHSTVLLPVLRKDFMLDPYQIIESRALGTDCVLLILRALSDMQAIELETAAHELGMDVLVEVHNEAEMERALKHLTSPLIGINNRDLKTLNITLGTAERIATMIPHDRIGVCESGIRRYEDIIAMRKKNLHVFLVGDALMRAENVMQATRKLLGAVG